MQPLELKKLVLESGEIPFDTWFDALGDQTLQAAAAARLARVRAGNLGDHKALGGMLWEQFCHASKRLQIGPADEAQGA